MASCFPRFNPVILTGICATAVGMSGQVPVANFGLDLGFMPGKTNKHGACQLPDLAPGRYEHVRAGVNEKMIVGSSISGKITKAGGGAPAARICIFARDSQGNAVAFASSGPSGAYTVGHLAPAVYGLDYFPCSGGTGLAEVIKRHVQLRAAPVRGIDVALPAAGVISGAVTVDGSPGPIGGICVQAVPLSGNAGSQVSESAATSANGRYRLTDLAPGKYRVGFSSDCVFGLGGLVARSLTAPVAVTGGSIVSGIDTTLLTYGGTQGAVQVGGKQFAGVCVLAFPKASQRAAPAVAVTSASGAYQIGGLAPRTYVVEFATGCGAAKFATRWFMGARSRSAAAPVAVTAGTITSGIDG